MDTAAVATHTPAADMIPAGHYLLSTVADRLIEWGDARGVGGDTIGQDEIAELIYDLREDAGLPRTEEDIEREPYDIERDRGPWNWDDLN